VDTPAVAPFRAASRYFVDAVAAVPRERYKEKWSDAWSYLDLIGHGNRANVLPVEYYERPVPVAGPEYMLPENIEARAREAVLQLGDDPVATVRTASDRVLALVAAAPDDAVVGTPFSEMPLDTYLHMRTAELVIHGLDLGIDVPVPEEALEDCAVFVVRRAVQTGRGVEVVLALSGRGDLTPGFNVF
jgi:hypothetical protein